MESKSAEGRIKKSTLMTLVIALSIVVIALVVALAIRGAVASESNVDIGPEKAKNIALEDAKVKIDDVTFTKCVLDKDKGKQIYDIEFYTDMAEYDYEISADTGNVFSRDTEPVKQRKKVSKKKNNVASSKGTKKANDASKYIGVEKARSIALRDAGISSQNAYFNKAALDHDDGYPVYDIEFRSGDIEYDYEINAVNGSVIEKSVEREVSKKNYNNGSKNSGSSNSGASNSGGNSNGSKHYDDDDDDDDYDDDHDDDDDDDDDD